MKIIRAEHTDTDLFSQHELDYGACCFFTEDKAYRYYFQINEREATIFANTDSYMSQAIDAFLYYSSFIVSVKDQNGQVLCTKTPHEPYLQSISSIQPSQFYVNQSKLECCKKWIKSNEDIYIPIVIKDGMSISLDGHTRLRAAMDLYYSSVYVYPAEY